MREMDLEVQSKSLIAIELVHIVYLFWLWPANVSEELSAPAGLISLPCCLLVLMENEMSVQMVFVFFTLSV